MREYYINEWPPFSPEDEVRKENARIAERLILNAALTAPAGGGVPQMEAHLVYGREEMEKLARKMEEFSSANPKNHLWENVFKYEAVMIREQTYAVVFLGNYRAASDPFDSGCGGCGGIQGLCWVYTRRKVRLGRIDMAGSSPTTQVDGPLCLSRMNAFGYAVGSALWMANRLLVDSRPMMSVGLAGQKLGYCPNSPLVVGLPVSAYSKSPYNDVSPDYHVISQWKAVDGLRKYHPLVREIRRYDYRSWDPYHEEQAGSDEEGE